METFIRLIDRPAVLDAISAVFGLLTFVFLGIYFELGKADWAAWVQAVGSIVAIIVAFAVANRQQREAANKLKADDRQRISIVRELHADLRMFCLRIKDAFDTDSMDAIEEYPWHRLMHRAHAITQIPILSVPTAEIAVSIIGIQADIDKVSNALRALWSQREEQLVEHPAGPDVTTSLEILLSRLDTTILRCDRELGLA